MMTGMRYVLFAALAAKVLGVAGCVAPAAGERASGASAANVPAQRTGSGKPGDVAFPAPPTRAPAMQTIDMAFDIIRADLPLDTVRHSRKLWNHLGAAGMAPQQTALLARNAVRIGVGTRDAWPAIRAIIENAAAEVRQDQLLVQRDLPLVLDVGTLNEPQSLFVYDDQGRLDGKTFPAGTKLIQFDYALHPSLGGSVEVHVGFELRQAHGGMAWDTADGVVRQVPAEERYLFTSSRAAFTVPPEGFMVLGPSELADNRHLLGGSFFTAGSPGAAREIVLIVTPLPHRVRADARSRGRTP